jgi:hypothetical protein
LEDRVVCEIDITVEVEVCNRAPSLVDRQAQRCLAANILSIIDAVTVRIGGKGDG